jgi:Bifunctional DNA primase/polymerase, N-terminal
VLKAALTLAQTGLAVFPCGADKAPLTTRGFKDATTDPDAIRVWASAWTMIGAAIPEGQIVLDVDPRNGGDETLALLPSLPRTRTTRTRSGGRHYWLRVPLDMNLRGTLGPGLDVKRAGKGYVIVPPSPGYSYIRGGEIARAPDWLLEELVLVVRESQESANSKFFPFEQGTAYGLAARRNMLAELAEAPEGGRNDALNKAAFAMAQLEAGGELARDAALTALMDMALHIGLTAWEARNTIESGWTAGVEVPRQAPAKETV